MGISFFTFSLLTIVEKLLKERTLMQNKPLEIFVSGTTFKQIHMLYDLEDEFVFRDGCSLNSTCDNPHYDFVLATVKQSQEHCRPILDYIIRSKGDQYGILKSAIKADSFVKVLPTISLSSNHASLDRVANMWKDVKFSEDFSSGLMVIQCEGGANGWAHVCCPRELVPDIIEDGLSHSKSYLQEKYGDIIAVSEPRPDISSSRFFDQRVIVRPHLTSIHSEYRILFSKDEEGKLDRVVQRLRKRTKVGGKYFQANMLAVEKDSTPKLLVQVTDPYVEIQESPIRKEEPRKLNIEPGVLDKGNYYRSIIQEMMSYPVDNPDILKAVTELVEVIPHWFGAIDLAVTNSGDIYVLEFSPEFGTKYMDSSYIQLMAQTAFKNYISYLSSTKE